MTINQAIKTKNFSDNRHKALVNILYTANIISNQLESVFAQFDISRQQYNALRILRGSYPEPTNCGHLKSVMLERNPDVTRLCNRLIAKNLIFRAPNPTNKRAMQLTINLEGLNLLEKIEPFVNKHSNGLGLSLDESEVLSNLLDKLRN